MVLAVFVFGLKSFLPFRVFFRGQKSLAKVLYLKNQCQVNCVSSVAIISIVGGKTGGGAGQKAGAVAPGAPAPA